MKISSINGKFYQQCTTSQFSPEFIHVCLSPCCHHWCNAITYCITTHALGWVQRWSMLMSKIKIFFKKKYFSRQPRRPLRWLQLRGGSGGCGAAAALRPRVRVRHPVQGGEHPGHDDAEVLRRKRPWCRWAPTSRASWRASSRTTTRPSAPPTPTVSLPL